MACNFVCEKCGWEESTVKDSRPFENGIRRRRECANCGHRWTTYETIEKPYQQAQKDVKELYRYTAERMKAIVETMNRAIEELESEANNGNSTD